MGKGKLIVIEGLDGSGKGLQSKLLASNLSRLGYKVHLVSFPDYDSESSSLIKMYLNGDFGKNPEDVNSYAATSFYAVDRYASYKMKWKQLYDNGYTIIADRYSTSNLIYQLAKHSRNEWESVANWIMDYEYNLLGLPKPDQVFYLSVPVEISQSLMSKRYNNDDSKKDIHERDVDYLMSCHHSGGYCSIVYDWTIINCMNYETYTLKDPNDIQSELLTYITK